MASEGVRDLLAAWIRAALDEDFDTLFDLSTDDLAESFVGAGPHLSDHLRQSLGMLDTTGLSVLSGDRVRAPNLEQAIVIKDPAIIAAGVVGLNGPEYVTLDQATSFLVEMTDEGGWRVAQWGDYCLDRYKDLFE